MFTQLSKTKGQTLKLPPRIKLDSLKGVLECHQRLPPVRKPADNLLTEQNNNQLRSAVLVSGRSNKPLSTIRTFNQVTFSKAVFWKSHFLASS